MSSRQVKPLADFHLQFRGDRTQFLHDVSRRLHQARAFPDQAVAAFRHWIVQGTGQGEYVASLLRGFTCGNQGAAVQTGLYDQHRQAQT